MVPFSKHIAVGIEQSTMAIDLLLCVDLFSLAIIPARLISYIVTVDNHDKVIFNAVMASTELIIRLDWPDVALGTQESHI